LKSKQEENASETSSYSFDDVSRFGYISLIV